MSNKPIPEGKLVDGDVTAALDTRFLNSMVLQGALDKRGTETLDVVIDRIEHHDVLKYENGQKGEDIYLLYFKGSDKPLKLAKINTKRLILMLGTIGAGWVGQKIQLCIESQFRPDLKAVGPCVRVKVIQTPEQAKARRAAMLGGES